MLSELTYVAIPNSVLVELINRYQDRYQIALTYIVEDFLEKTPHQKTEPEKITSLKLITGSKDEPDKDPSQ